MDWIFKSIFVGHSEVPGEGTEAGAASKASEHPCLVLDDGSRNC